MDRRDDDMTALMATARRGDEVAYRHLLTLLAHRLRVIVRAGLRRTGRDMVDCEDIVQETLLAIHLKRHTWDERQPLEPWVRAIARHKLIDHLRRRGVHAHVDLDEIAESVGTGPDEQAADVKECLDHLVRLPERQQAIVRWMSVEGLSAREVGARLDMNEGAVRTALHRALKALATAMRQAGGEGGGEGGARGGAS